MHKKPDFYAKKAKNENYAARSVYKLEEIQNKYRLIKSGMQVVDLGSAPGSWLQYAHKKVGKSGFVVGIDLQKINLSLGENSKIMQDDIFEVNPEGLLIEFGHFDGLISDMAPSTSGVRDVDHYNSMELCRRAFFMATILVKPGGFFVCKMFEGEESPEFIKELRKEFSFFKPLRPQATKKESREVFLIGNGFKEKI